MQLPTGGGKTIIFTFMAIEHVKKKANNKVLILTDRTELLKQAGGTFEKFNYTPSFIKPNHQINFDSQLFVGMVETISRRREKLKSFLKELTLVIVDEAHKGNFEKILELIPKNCVVIGATATPVSTKKHDLSKIYNNIVLGADTPQLIKEGYLSKYRHFAPKLSFDEVKVTAGEYNSLELLKAMDKPELYEGMIKFYEEHGKSKKTLIFCVNIEHAQRTTRELIIKGHKALCLTSLNSKEEREQILKEFESNSKGLLVNCGILTTGYDCPSIECIILNRATLSLPLYMQMIGRGSRTTPTKKQFTVIDMGNNYSYHGLWNHSKDWKKFFKYEKRKEQPAPVKNCPECEAINHAGARTCECCGFEFPFEKVEKVEKVLEIATQLEEVSVIDNYQDLPRHLKKDYEDMSINELIERAKYGSPKTGKPYKKAWIVHQLKRRPNKRQLIEKFATLNGYSKGWVFYQLNN